MPIIDDIERDFKEAMKARNEQVVSALRMVRSAAKNKQIDAGRPLTDEDATLLLKTLLKQYRDALTDFTEAGRTDLAAAQRAEIELLERYLPAAMTEAEIEVIARRVVEASPVRDFGRVMGLVMKEVGGQADGNAVRSVVERLLAASSAS
jgi:uncharacterized protein YqeY